MAGSRKEKNCFYRSPVKRLLAGLVSEREDKPSPGRPQIPALKNRQIKEKMLIEKLLMTDLKRFISRISIELQIIGGRLGAALRRLDVGVLVHYTFLARNEGMADAAF